MQFYPPAGGEAMMKMMHNPTIDVDYNSCYEHGLVSCAHCDLCEFNTSTSDVLVKRKKERTSMCFYIDMRCPFLYTYPCEHVVEVA